MKVSVIVPVYNSASYLSRCIESLCCQTYKNIEIILINDGSKDSSGDICDKYAALDSRIRVYHQKNSGVSEARNNGIRQAVGEVICFVDSDDEVLDDYIQELLNDFYKSQNTDLVFQGHVKLYDDGRKELISFAERVVSALDYNQLFNVFKISHHGNPISKLFKLNIIKDNNIRFNRNFTYNEDKIFILEYLSLCTGDVVFSNTANYNYYINLGSLSNGLLQPEEYLKPYKYFKTLIEKEFRINYIDQANNIVIYENFKIYLHMYINAVLVYKKGREKEYLDKLDDEDWLIYKYISKNMSSRSRKLIDFLLFNRLFLLLRIITPLFIKPLFVLRNQ